MVLRSKVFNCMILFQWISFAGSFYLNKSHSRQMGLMFAAADGDRHQKAIQAALEATKKYGAQSKEARVLWEIAEEIEDSIFSPCSERCDYKPQSPTLFVDKSKEPQEDD